MHKKIFMVLIGLFLVASFNMAQGTAEETGVSEPTAYINYVEGKVFFRDFQEVELNVILQEGDEINTQEGRIEILLKSNGVIRLDRNTRVIFSTLNDNSIMLKIWNGNIYVKKGKMEIGVKSMSKSLNLSQNEWYFVEPEKSFKKWNSTRNEELSLSNNQYLPEELGRYGYVLNRYGCWRNVPPYGYCWIPRVDFSWRPYFYGHWVWYPIIGWTWISYESFGWCVYHYGRWQWDFLFGWYWIPTRYWGPSWVYWYNYGNYWGWCPRWYDNAYYSRHRNYYNDSSSHIWTVVRRDQLQSRNIAKSVISKSELQKFPRISQNQLRTSISNSSTAMTTTKSISKNRIFSPSSQITLKHFTAPKQLSPVYSRNSQIRSQNSGFAPTRKIYSPSRSITSTRSQNYSPRNTISRNPYSYSFSRPKITSFSFPSRSFSRSSSFSRPSISRTTSGTIRKKR